MANRTVYAFRHETQALLQQLPSLLCYDVDAGELTWRVRTRDLMPSGKSPTAWNARFAGRLAQWEMNHGYLAVKIYGTLFLAHRVVWALCNGAWPDGEIDHIDRDKHNNRLSNLRVVDPQTQRRNMPKRKNNKSGVTGVHWHNGQQRWHVAVSGRYIGSFRDKVEAVLARKSAIADTSYSPTHGL